MDRSYQRRSHEKARGLKDRKNIQSIRQNESGRQNFRTLCSVFRHRPMQRLSNRIARIFWTLTKIECFCCDSRITLEKKKNYALLENVDQLCFTNARLIISFFQVFSFKYSLCTQFEPIRFEVQFHFFQKRVYAWVWLSNSPRIWAQTRYLDFIK